MWTDFEFIRILSARKDFHGRSPRTFCSVIKPKYKSCQSNDMKLFLNAAVVATAASLGHGLRPDSTCSQTEGVIIGTGSVHETKTSSAADCCDACYNFGYNCLAYTFQPSTGDCFLKDNADSPTQEDDRISGTPSGGPSPAANRTVATRACQPPHDQYVAWKYCCCHLSSLSPQLSCFALIASMCGAGTTFAILPLQSKNASTT